MGHLVQAADLALDAEAPPSPESQSERLSDALAPVR
jgi:hypothetical protein